MTADRIDAGVWHPSFQWYYCRIKLVNWEEQKWVSTGCHCHQAGRTPGPLYTQRCQLALKKSETFLSKQTCYATVTNCYATAIQPIFRPWSPLHFSSQQSVFYKQRILWRSTCYVFCTCNSKVLLVTVTDIVHSKLIFSRTISRCPCVSKVAGTFRTAHQFEL